MKQPIYRTCDRQQNAHDTAQHDHRNKVGHIQDKLYLLLDLIAFNAVEQEG